MTPIFLILFSLHSALETLPPFQEVKRSFQSSDMELMDRNGEVIQDLRADSRGRRLHWIGLEDMSPSLIKAVLYSEDKRFYEHGGVDWRAVFSILVEGIYTTKSYRGASTITMQFASILDKRLRPKGQRRTVAQKWEQMRAARKLERAWSKQEILEAYLNMVTFRGELEGIAAGSRGIFDKEPHGLDEAESIILASLIRSPNAEISDVITRGCFLAGSMASHTPCETIRAVAEGKLSRPYYVRPHANIASHVAHLLLGKNGGRVVSTLDGKLQRFATEALRYQLTTHKIQNVNDGAVLVVENTSGDILAYIANGGESSSALFVDGIRAKRQAGSTLKPFLYELALEKRLLTPASMLDDLPLNISTPRGLYIPQDYDNEFKGPISVRTALASSLNVPAVRTLMMISTEVFTDRLRRLGFDLDESGDYYGFSLALGSADVSLLELVNAYRTLANGGWWSNLRLTFDNTRSEKNIMTKEAVFVTNDILSDRTARSITFGLENPLSTRYWTAVKTGTSKDMRDNWCIGYSRKYTVGVWVGNFSGEPMWDVSGITGAAPVWLEIMNYLHHSSPSAPPKAPVGVVKKQVEFQAGIEQNRDEWFLNGTEPVETAITDHMDELPRITYPADGTTFALDPDIPDGQQAIFFEASPPLKFVWMLNGERIGNSDTTVSWTPIYGHYTLSLVDEQDKVIDFVMFEVRGKGLNN